MTFAEIADEFQAVDPTTRLELLLEFAEGLPPLPEDYRALRDRGLNLVHECQSPVFLMSEVHDGHVRVRADVPEEAPTARGFTAVLVEAFDGAPVEEVLAAPEDALGTLGLARLLGMQRTRGLSAIYARLRHDVRRRLETADT